MIDCSDQLTLAQEEIRALEAAYRREVSEMEGEIERRRLELLSVTRANTKLLTDTSDLAHDKKVLDASLDAALRAPSDNSAQRTQV